MAGHFSVALTGSGDFHKIDDFRLQRPHDERIVDKWLRKGSRCLTFSVYLIRPVMSSFATRAVPPGLKVVTVVVGLLPIVIMPLSKTESTCLQNVSWTINWFVSLLCSWIAIASTSKSRWVCSSCFNLSWSPWMGRVLGLCVNIGESFGLRHGHSAIVSGNNRLLRSKRHGHCWS